MGNFLFSAKQYIHYLLRATDEHGVHSPFVFDLYTRAIREPKWYYAFDDLEMMRDVFLQNHQKINVTDFGAGSQKLDTSERRVSDIASVSISTPKTCQLLFRLVDFFAPRTIVELGTCLGISTLYMAHAYHKSRVFTFEGCPSLAALAAKNFKHTPAPIRQNIGNLDETLPKALAKLPEIDFVFLDANHRYKPTLHYFELLLPHLAENGIMVFDDIHLSEEMQRAWEAVKNHDAVSVTIDLFQVGLVFFHKKQEKQHFVLKY